MSKIYIATSGSYSDYQIEAIFKTEAEAKKYVVLNNAKGGEYDYEEHEYYKGDIDISGVIKVWALSGQVAAREPYSYQKDILKNNKKKFEKVENCVGFAYRAEYEVETKEQALKCFYDDRAKYEATEQGLWVKNIL